MTTHFIAIGGSAMHNLALALHNKGYKVTGSDDAILSHLNHVWIRNVAFRNGLVSRKITNDIDAVILGMHAKEQITKTA
jgi:UDP-N-acetylmuramate: L-alanyl-gamma-D-glutamyl-meso-diaminopimelate ligase